MLCEVCHTRPATVHLTTVKNGAPRTGDVCEECFRATSDVEERDFAARARSERCHFCGAAVNMGGTDPLAQRFGVDRLRFFCFRCSPIYGSCVARVLSTLPRNLPPEQRPDLLARLTEDVDRQMKKRLEEGDGHGR